jgi:hypothetical protein
LRLSPWMLNSATPGALCRSLGWLKCSGRQMVRSECAEFDRRAVPGMVHSSDVELGTCRATRRRVMVSSNPYGGRLHWTRWRFVTLLSHKPPGVPRRRGHIRAPSAVSLPPVSSRRNSATSTASSPATESTGGILQLYLSSRATPSLSHAEHPLPTVAARRTQPTSSTFRWSAGRPSMINSGR